MLYGKNSARRRYSPFLGICWDIEVTNEAFIHYILCICLLKLLKLVSVVTIHVCQNVLALSNACGFGVMPQIDAILSRNIKIVSS